MQSEFDRFPDSAASPTLNSENTAPASRDSRGQSHVGCSLRRTNRTAPQSHEQADNATAGLANRVLRLTSLTHRGFTVGRDLAEPAERLFQGATVLGLCLLKPKPPLGLLPSAGRVRETDAKVSVVYIADYEAKELRLVLRPQC